MRALFVAVTGDTAAHLPGPPDCRAGTVVWQRLQLLLWVTSTVASHPCDNRNMGWSRSPGCCRVVDAAVSCRFIRVASQAVGRIGAGVDGVDNLCSGAVMAGRTGTGTVGGDIVLGAINLRPVRHDMADATRRAVRQISCPQCHSVTMRMAVEVVRRMTLRTVASGCCWSIRCCVMAAGTAVMFLDVRCVGKRSSNSYIMTTSTFSLQRNRGRMILAYMGGKVARYTSMTLAAITGCGTRQLGRVVMADITVVMLHVVGRIDKGRVIDRCAVTAGTTGRRGDLGRMILSMRGPVTGYAAVTHGAVAGTRRLRAVGRMARGTGVMLLVIRRVDEVLTRGQRRRMTARTLAVQGDIASSCMIDVMIRPDATRMTGRTGVRTAFDCLLPG